MKSLTTASLSALTMLIVSFILGVQSLYILPEYTNTTYQSGLPGNLSDGSSAFEKRFDPSTYEWQNAIELHQFENAPSGYTNMVIYVLLSDVYSTCSCLAR